MTSDVNVVTNNTSDDQSQLPRSCRAHPQILSACMQTRKCARGNACPFTHNVFEYWLHPTRYRTVPCEDGKNCTRKVGSLDMEAH
jgi:hypothetical protein